MCYNSLLPEGYKLKTPFRVNCRASSKLSSYPAELGFSKNLQEIRLFPSREAT